MASVGIIQIRLRVKALLTLSSLELPSIEYVVLINTYLQFAIKLAIYPFLVDKKSIKYVIHYTFSICLYNYFFVGAYTRNTPGNTFISRGIQGPLSPSILVGKFSTSDSNSIRACWTFKIVAYLEL